MSEEKLEIVKRGFTAITRLDAEAMLELFDPEIEWQVPAAGGEGDRGYDGVRRFATCTRRSTDQARGSQIRDLATESSRSATARGK